MFFCHSASVYFHLNFNFMTILWYVFSICLFISLFSSCSSVFYFSVFDPFYLCLVLDSLMINSISILIVCVFLSVFSFIPFHAFVCFLSVCRWVPFTFLLSLISFFCLFISFFFILNLMFYSFLLLHNLCFFSILLFSDSKFSFFLFFFRLLSVSFLFLFLFFFYFKIKEKSFFAGMLVCTNVLQL